MLICPKNTLSGVLASLPAILALQEMMLMGVVGVECSRLHMFSMRKVHVQYKDDNSISVYVPFIISL
jgi:hypothetical protein